MFIRPRSPISAAAAKSLQSCPTLCDPKDSSPPGSPVPGILQARILEWVAISFSNAWKWKVKVKLISRVWLLATPWTTAYQAPLSMGFSRQEYWSGLPLHSNRYEMISHCGMICISLMINSVVHLFLYLLSICVSSLHILDISLLSDIWKFFYSVGCLFILLMVFFAFQDFQFDEDLLVYFCVFFCIFLHI